MQYFVRVRMEETNQDIHWYVMRVTYNRVMKAKAKLDEIEMENFVPMSYAVEEKNGKRVRKLVPVINNILFLHADRNHIDAVKRHPDLYDLLRYNMDLETRKPMLVPERQMNYFMAVSARTDEDIVYLSPEKLKLKKGERVRIKKGAWEGVEGQLVKIKRGMRVLVVIPGVLGVATIALHPDMLESLEETDEK